VLIATTYFERPLASAQKDILLLQPGSGTKSWDKLMAPEKREYITSLRKTSGSPSIIYLTLPFEDVKSRMAGGKSIAANRATMEENWGLPIDAMLGFQGLVMPYGEMETWDGELVGALAVLSEAMVGQGDVVGGMIIAKMKEGKKKVVEARDVLEMGKELYRRALWGLSELGRMVGEREGACAD
jgi:hypothetical protein